MAFSGTYPSRPYALITGASEGIGAEFAIQLARRGTHSLILVARTTSKLEKVGDNAQKEYMEQTGNNDLDVVIISQDLSEQKAAEKVWDQCKHLPIALLIGNAGIAYGGPFEAHNLVRVRQLLDLNVGALTELSVIALPYLKKAARHYEGIMPNSKHAIAGLINVASVAALVPVPGMALYSASKAYILFLTEALHHEQVMEASSLPVICVLPGPTQSEIWSKEGAIPSSVLAPFTSAAHVVSTSLRGLDWNTAIVIPGWVNNIMAFGLRFSPRFLARRISLAVMNQTPHEDPYLRQGTAWKRNL